MTVIERDYREAERTLARIDRILVGRVLGEISDAEALKRVKAAVGAWTDPKETR